MLQEFKKFIMRGNVIDLAVGVIVGAAFSKIVDSLVADIIMPIVAVATGGGVDFSNIFIPLSKAVTAPSLAEARKQGAVLAVGNFVTIAINFVLLAFVIYLFVKLVNKLRGPDPVPEKPAPPRSELLLEEIRDALVKK
ncbi:large conductance mechanosensitive channel protein MscL [Roseiarcaceae bacterium H3SJ34-1]|uniref:large conductance mechanosensitive channel protein MscL n=1 Tax=Terripilifer ovatus TaxID=3032367 RepID=UPI003AB97EFE|nr:large conductance mechanosensitive channel protein MscL [Roseiarcaceae bacterium H3SJ34-1]